MQGSQFVLVHISKVTSEVISKVKSEVGKTTPSKMIAHTALSPLLKSTRNIFRICTVNKNLVVVV